MPEWPAIINYSVMPWIAIVERMPILALVLQIALVWCAVLVLHYAVSAVLERIAAPLPTFHRLLQYGRRPARLAIFLFLLQIVLRDDNDAYGVAALLLRFDGLALVMALTWLGVRCIKALSDTIVERNPADVPDNLQARRIQTQTRVLARSAIVLIIMIGTGLSLMTLPQMRQLGTSLLASAGVAGLVVGLAARPVLTNLLAGLQIALTQPIRLEDVVIIQNEWGNIEEITGAYVVVRIWDQRRLIVPLQWFIENPFQNWTRTNADILGTVTLWVDYRLPMTPLREELEHLCRGAPEWDGRVCLIQVVEAGERAMQLRALVSARDSPLCWDLRCRIREGLLDFIQRNHPECLPHLRTEVTPETGATALTPEQARTIAGTNLPPN